MVIFDEDNWPVLPTRQGGSVGKAIEGRMGIRAGGFGTIRTEILPSPGGGEVMLRTRNGFPEFTVTKPAATLPVTGFTFQGLSVSTEMPYGCVLANGVVVGATQSSDQSSLVWGVANLPTPTPPLALTNDVSGYKGNMDWRDTREPRQTERIVTWRGMGGLARNTPYMRATPPPSTPAPFDTYSSSPHDGTVWIDGIALPVIPNGRMVLCAAIFLDGQVERVRAVCIDRPGYSHTAGNFIYGGVSTLHLYTFQVVGSLDWGYSGSLSLGDFFYLWQAPVFNSSGTEFCGLIRRATNGTSVDDYPETEFTADFSATPTLVAANGSEDGSYSVSDSNYSISASYKKTVMAVDYVGDFKEQMVYGEISHQELNVTSGPGGGQGTDTWDVISQFFLGSELSVIAAQYGHTLETLSSNRLVRIVYSGISGYLHFLFNGYGLSPLGWGYLVSPFEVTVKARPAGNTDIANGVYTNIKRFYASNGLLLDTLYTIRNTTGEYTTYYPATCGYSIAVVEDIAGVLGRIEVTLHQEVTLPVTTPATDVTTVVVPQNTSAITSVDLRSRTYTKTVDEVSVCGVYSDGDNPGLGVGEDLPYVLQQFSKSNIAAIPTLKYAPLNHASHPAGNAAVITRSDLTVTDFVTLSGSTNIGALGCAAGANKVLTSPIFFKRKSTP